MGIGTSLFLLAVGAILAFAVKASVAGLSIGTVGIILMVIGALGLALSLVLANGWRRREEAVVVREREVY